VVRAAIQELLLVWQQQQGQPGHGVTAGATLNSASRTQSAGGGACP